MLLFVTWAKIIPIMKKLLPLVLLPLLFLCFNFQSQAQNLNAKIPFDKSIKTGQLDNGLKYFIKKNAKPENKIELRLALNAGAMQEDDDQQGLAHFMEHMNFNGLKNFPKNEIVRYLQSIGVKFGADLNAYTSFDETVYILPIPTDDKDKIEKGFTILSDWSGNALLEGSEIDAERGVVLEESRGGKGADDRMMQKWLPKYMVGSRYAKRLPIGKDPILKNFKHDVLNRFYIDWYRPNLQAVMVVGDIEVAEAERLIKKYFSDFKNPANPRPRPKRYDVPQRSEKEAMILTDKEATYTVFQLNGNVRPTAENKTQGDYRGDLVEGLFNNLLSNRYDEYRNSEKPPFLFGSTRLGGGWARGYENFSSVAYCGPDQIKSAVQTVVREAIRARTHGFTATELERAKSSYLSRYEKSYNERDKTESRRYVSELVRHFLEGESVPGIDWEYNFTKNQLPSITLEEVNSIAKQIDIDKKYFALVTSKPSDKLPSEKQLLQWIDETVNEDIQAYKEEAVASKLLPKDPMAGKILQTSENKDLGTTTWTLSNGAKVTLKPTDFKNDEIRFSAKRKGGYSLYKGKDLMSGIYNNNVVDEMGYGEFDQTSLGKYMTGKNVRVGISSGLYAEDISGSSTKKDLQTMFELLYLKSNYAKMNEKGFKSFISKQKQQAGAMKANPRMAFMVESQKYLYKNNPYANDFPEPEEFDQIDAKNALDFYNERFNSAYGMHYVFVGSFENEEIKPLILKYIGGMSGKKIATDFRDVGKDKRKGNNKFVFKKGSEEKAMIMDMMYGDAKYDADEASKLYILSQVINTKITKKLREEIGGMYSGGMSIRLEKYPKPSYTVTSFIPCGPEKLEELRTAYYKILQEVQTGSGITDADVTEATAPALQSYSESIKKNNYWMSILTSSYYNNTDPNRILTYPKRLKSITTAELNRLAKQYLNAPNKFINQWQPEEEKP